MGRRGAFVLAGVVLLLLVGTAAGDPGEEKQQVDARIGEVEAAIAEAQGREAVLTDELSALTGRVRGLEGDVASAEATLGELEADLARAEGELRRLHETLRRQTARLEALEREHRQALGQLERRVRQIYMEDEPDAFAFLAGAASFGDLLDHAELLDAIGRQDERIVERVGRAERTMRAARAETRRATVKAARLRADVASSVARQRAVRDRLAASQRELVEAGSETERALASIREHEETLETEAEDLRRESAALAAAIRAAQAQSQAQSQAPASTGSGVSSAGLIWPVSGPVVSGFGMRWGRMHEGIDIAVPTGTPVVASAAGTVIHAGWLGGYGNLVVVDHGNGLSTAYAHNSSLAVGVGQAVRQGEVIAYAGSTGNSSGPHVHFEVRVNGVAVDPLGYL